MKILSALLYSGIMIVGWFYPVVALAAFGFMGLVLLAGRRKKWCSGYCPRGSFLDVVMKRLSPKRPFPRWMTGRNVWIISMAAFLILFVSQVYLSGLVFSFSWVALGGIFYRMCFVTSMVALPMALLLNHRGWCAICPVGNLLRK